MTTEIIRNEINEIISTLQQIAADSIEVIEQAAALVIAAYKKGGKVIIFGNGGSAADAQHIAAEFVGRFKVERPGMAAIALTTNTSILTAVGNDYGYELVFARQVEALGCAEDVFIGISTSGNSPNVVLALEKANELGGATIAFSGAKAAKLDEVADLSIKIPSHNTPHIQEGHIVVGHIICGLVEQAFQEQKTD